jgi:glycosyltransferase involved in cell wall biosynthesis
MFSRKPLSVAYCQSSKFSHLVKKLVDENDFDIIHTEFVRATTATAKLKNSPKVYDAVDSLSLAYGRSLNAPNMSFKQRMIAGIEYKKMRKYEPSVIKKYDYTLVSSHADKDELEKEMREDGNSLSKIKVLSNGVDLEYYQYKNGRRKSGTIMFLGKMSYYVNVASVLWFYSEVLPKIQREEPDVKFVIVGRDPDPRISALEADPLVEVTGTVPDVRPYLYDSTVSVSPMVSGSGIQNKMLEAMATGTPCVGTSIACQALNVIPGKDVIVADGIDEFANSVIELMKNDGHREELAKNGRLYVEKNHHWESVGNQLTSVYSELL